MVRDSFQDKVFIGSSVHTWHENFVLLCPEQLPYASMHGVSAAVTSMYGAQQQSQHLAECVLSY